MATRKWQKVAGAPRLVKTQCVGNPARCIGSVRQYVLVIGHGIYVIKGDAGPGLGVRRSTVGVLVWRAAPEAQVAENLLDDLAVIDHGNDAHGVLTDRTAERVAVPDDVGDSICIFSTEKGLRRMYWASFSKSARFSEGTGSP